MLGNRVCCSYCKIMNHEVSRRATPLNPKEGKKGTSQTTCWTPQNTKEHHQWTNLFRVETFVYYSTAYICVNFQVTLDSSFTLFCIFHITGLQKFTQSLTRSFIFIRTNALHWVKQVQCNHEMSLASNSTTENRVSALGKKVKSRLPPKTSYDGSLYTDRLVVMRFLFLFCTLLWIPSSKTRWWYTRASFPSPRGRSTLERRYFPAQHEPVGCSSATRSMKRHIFFLDCASWVASGAIYWLCLSSLRIFPKMYRDLFHFISIWALTCDICLFPLYVV